MNPDISVNLTTFTGSNIRRDKDNTPGNTNFHSKKIIMEGVGNTEVFVVESVSQLESVYRDLENPTSNGSGCSPRSSSYPQSPQSSSISMAISSSHTASVDVPTVFSDPDTTIQCPASDSRRRREPRGSTLVGPTLRLEPMGKAIKTAATGDDREKRRDVLDRVFDSVEDTVCRQTDPDGVAIVSRTPKSIGPPSTFSRINSIVDDQQKDQSVEEREDVEAGSQAREANVEQHYELNENREETARSSPHDQTASGSKQVLPKLLRSILKTKAIIPEINTSELQTNDLLAADEFARSPTERVDNRGRSKIGRAAVSKIGRAAVSRKGRAAVPVTLEPEKPKADLLDFLFHNAEVLVCRQHQARALMDSDGGDHTDTVDEEARSDGSSPIRLHKLAHPDAHQTDALDYVFECGPSDQKDQQIPITPSRPEDRDVLDYAFECGTGQQPVKLAGLDNPQESVGDVSKHNDVASMISAHKLARGSIGSLLDMMSSDTSDDMTQRSDRLAELRKKKRLLESHLAVVQSNSNDPGILIPRGYKEKHIPSKIKTEHKTSTAQQERDKSKRFRRALILAIVMFMVGTALILIAISFFLPTKQR